MLFSQSQAYGAEKHHKPSASYDIFISLPWTVYGGEPQAVMSGRWSSRPSKVVNGPDRDQLIEDQFQKKRLEGLLHTLFSIHIERCNKTRPTPGGFKQKAKCNYTMESHLLTNTCITSQSGG